ncbi:MAG: hypothetical protein DRP83_00130 [Planctomycetota bacterium]|nr:MAG: hypothetical protein DRP83_00130 [Planctomycetota bacterium]
MPYNTIVMRNGLLKYAGSVWFRPPGVPFTFAGSPDYQERLTGMTKWAPRGMVENVAEGLQEGRTVEELAQEERSKGLLKSLGVGALAGGTAGGVAGRVVGGEAVAAPFKELLSKGVSRNTLKGLWKIPGSAKLLPLLGIGGGLLAGGALWGAGRGRRESQARQVSRGLLAERVLQRNALKEALKTEQPYNQPLLRGVPLTSASADTPYAVNLPYSGM